MLRAFPMSLTGAASCWLRNELSEPDESLFRSWERFKELLMKCPQQYLTDTHEVILFYNGLDVPTRQILDSKGAIPTKTVVDAKVAIQEMAKYAQKWHNRTSTKTKSIETSNGLDAIQAQLNSIEREIKKVNEKKEAHVLKILETYSIGTTLHDNTLPQKEKDPGSFTLPCFIHNVCFDKPFVDLGESVNVMTFFTYTNLGLGDLAHTRYRHVNAHFLPTLSIDRMTKRFYNSIIKDEGLTIIDDMDETSGLVLGMPFCKKFVTFQNIMEKFAQGDECE
nr:hypothetical protein [Tanacetum cinerariifolium]